MYHTWFFQKRLAKALNSALEGLTLLACFSQQKDELILSFASKQKELHIRADLSSRVGILSFRDTFRRARRNSVDLFDELLNQQVTSVSSYLHERSFQIKFNEEFQLIFKMHGSRSNVLIAKSNQVLKIFRNNLPSDLSIRPSELDNQTKLSEDVVLKLLGKKNREIYENQRDRHSQFCDLLDSNSISVGLREDQPYLKLVEAEHPMLVTDNAIEASNFFVELHYRHAQLAREKVQISQIIRKQIRQSENYILKTQRKLNDITHQRSPEEIANIVMANLHALKTGLIEANLEDLYAGGAIKIKLNPKLSPQKNAENFYRKSKNKKIEIQKLKDNISSKQQVSEKLEKQSAFLERIDQIKELRTFIAENFRSITKKKEPLPYHKFEIDGYDVFVGKNAKSNDILTQKIATKNDLWLHARDVSGSHVVIRDRLGNSFPASVIEKVAALAAWFSKRKTDSLCPVIFTPKKFVRKIKGAPAGQVVVEKEDVIMVVPSREI